MSDIYLIAPSIPCSKCNNKINITKLMNKPYGDDLICKRCGEILPASYYDKFLGKSV